MVKLKSQSFKISLIFVFLSTLLSCMKKPNLDEPSTPASLMEVQKAMIAAWGQADPASMMPKDFMYQETEQRIELQEPKIVLQEGITVSKREETDNEFNYTFLYQTAVPTSDQTQQVTQEAHRCVSKTSDGCQPNTASDAVTVNSISHHLPHLLTDLVSFAGNKNADPIVILKNLTTMQNAGIKTMSNDSQLTLGFEKFVSLAYACQTSAAVKKYCVDKLGADSCEISCSNLTTAEEIQPAPDLIKSQPNCGGFTDCKINIKRVSFDWNFILVKGKSTQKQKINYTIAVSPDMPFLSRVNESCSRGLIDVPQIGSKVLVGICNRVKNYQPGH